MTSDIERAVAEALDSTVIQSTQLGGGDVAQAFRVELESQGVVFAKTKPDAAPEFFDTEARGLRWLREADTLPVPEVLAVGTAAPLLVLEWISEGGGRPSSDAEFGQRLAALHQTGAPSFGREDRRTTGSRRLPNEPTDTWAEFYSTCRLLPLARMAGDERALPERTVRGFETVASRLAEFGATDEAPARLHGDLWAGNRLVDRSGTSWLIDPAAHGGHREFDLAMMQLFGGWAPDVFAHYNEVFPLEPEWRSRVALHQLAPLAVHAIKFGGSYAAATQAALDQYL